MPAWVVCIQFAIELMKLLRAHEEKDQKIKAIDEMKRFHKAMVKGRKGKNYEDAENCFKSLGLPKPK